MKQITIITDGSCLGNGKKDAYGGWAAALVYKDHRKEIYGSDHDTTNNRMELTAVVQATKKLTLPCDILVVTDSVYVCNVINGLQKWANNNWYTTGTNRPKNLDLVKALWTVLGNGKHQIRFQYVKGHAGDPDNERVDQLARSSARALRAMDEARLRKAEEVNA